MMRQVARGAMVAAVLGLVAVAVACGGDDDDDGGATDPSAADTADRADSASAPSASMPGTPGGDGEPDDVATDPDGTLRVATFTGYFWDPAHVTGGYAVTQLALVYDRLVHTAADGSLIPGLAESWEYDDAGTTLTFHLRDDVDFQDDENFDAEAAKVNIDRSRTLGDSSSKADLVRIEEVVAVDETTLELHLASADATLPAVFSGAAGAMISPAAIDDPNLDQNPVGAGMFKLVDFSPSSDYTVERWDGYWDPDAVKVNRIEFRVLTDSTARTNALRSGQVDIAPIEPADVAALEGVDGLEVRLDETLRYVYLAMNLADTPVDELKVRQALSYAIDRQALVETMFYGFGEPSVQPWPAGYMGHVDGLEDGYPYDPDRARELLAEAGLPDGFSAEIIVVPAPAVYRQLGEAVQAQLAEVGIDLEVRLTEATQLGDAFYIDKTAAFALLYTNGSIDPANSVGSRYSATGFFNPGGYSTPELEDLYQQALTTTDPDARATVFEDLTQEVVDNVLDLPLFFAREPQGVGDRVVGYESFVTGRPEFRGVGVTG